MPCYLCPAKEFNDDKYDELEALCAASDFDRFCFMTWHAGYLSHRGSCQSGPTESNDNAPSRATHPREYLPLEQPHLIQSMAW